MNNFGSVLLRQIVSFHRNMGTCSRSLKFSKKGEPLEVLNIYAEELGKPKGTQVLVEMLAAPIHPVDVNIIQGRYPLRPKLPAVGGIEGVGKVIKTGEKVKKLCKGQHVVMLSDGLGTWRTNALYCESQLMPVPDKIPIPAAAQLVINPATAYRLLKDFVKLKPGDTVLQNGANSAVGQSIHQLCKIWKIKSVGVVRKRPNIGKLKRKLKCLGATKVLTEEELCETTIFREKKLKRPVLALNCVGGSSAGQLARHLDTNGQLITYGGMSRKPTPAGTAYLIFKNLVFRGFWLTRWNRCNFQTKQQKAMYEEIMKLMCAGKFKAPAHKYISIDNYEDAAAAFCMKGFQNKKYLFKLDCK